MWGRKAQVRVWFFLPVCFQAMLSGATGILSKGEKGTVLLCYKSRTESAGASQGGLEHRQKQALLSQAGEQSVAMLQPCHGHGGRQGGRTGAQASDT